MYVLLTLTIQTTIDVENEEDYEAIRDAHVRELEKKGFSVDITSEDSSEDSDEFYGE